MGEFTCRHWKSSCKCGAWIELRSLAPEHVPFLLCSVICSVCAEVERWRGEVKGDEKYSIAGHELL